MHRSDASRSVLGGRTRQREWIRFSPLPVRMQLLRKIGVDIAERAKKTLGVTYRDARCAVGCG